MSEVGLGQGPRWPHAVGDREVGPYPKAREGLQYLCLGVNLADVRHVSSQPSLQSYLRLSTGPLGDY